MPARRTEARQAASLAILPFANLTDDPAKEYLSDGLAAELISTMSRGSGLRIPSYTSSRAYKNRAIDLRQIDRELGVDSVLEGEVKAGPNRICVNVQLIDVASGFHRWSEGFEHPPSDLLELQEELAGAISSALQAHLAPLRRTSTSSGAFDLYLKARALENSPSHDNFGRAADLYRQAAALDPGFSLALARLAGVLCVGLANGTFPADALAEARSAAERAIAADQSVAAGHAALASVCLRQGDWLLADAAHKRAMTCGPADAQALIAHGSFLATAGYLTQACEKFESAAELEPTNTRAALTCASFHSLAGNDGACDRWVANAMALGCSPDQVPLTQIRARKARENGDPAGAARLWVTGLPQPVIESGLEDVCRLAFEADAGRCGREQALGALAAYWSNPGVQELVARGTPVAAMVLVLHAVLDDLDGAYRVIGEVERRLHNGHLDETCVRIVWSRTMEAFRQDPRFAGSMERLGLMTFWRRHGWPDLWTPKGARPLADLLREWHAGI